MLITVYISVILIALLADEHLYRIPGGIQWQTTMNWLLVQP